jgi:hypothetical protein
MENAREDASSIFKFFSDEEIAKTDISLHLNIDQNIRENEQKIQGLTPKEDALIFRDDPSKQEEMQEEANKILQMGYRENPGCTCADEYCPHKSTINPFALMMVGNLKRQFIIVDFDKWNPLTYPLFKIDKAVDINFTQCLNSVNMIRVSYPLQIKERRRIIQRVGDFVEGLIIRGNPSMDENGKPIWPKIHMEFNSAPIHLTQRGDGYYFLGMVPLSVARYTEVAIVFDDEIIDLPTSIEVVYHIDVQKINRLETAQMFNNKFGLEAEFGAICPHVFPTVDDCSAKKVVGVYSNNIPHSNGLQMCFLVFEDGSQHMIGIGKSEMYKELLDKYYKK